MMKILHKRKVKVVDSTQIEFVGTQYLDKPEMQLFHYDENSISENKNFNEPQKISEYFGKNRKVWFNIHGLHDSSLIRKICSNIKVHRLVVQDLLDTTHVSRVRDFDQYLFFTVKSHLLNDDNEIEIEQVSFILGEDFLFTFQEKKGDHFAHIRSRLRDKIGLVREKSVDYLLFLLLEAIIDNYHITIQKIENEIETKIVFDDVQSTHPNVIAEIEKLKLKLNILRKSLLPILDSLIKIEKGFAGLISETNLKYFSVLKDMCQFLSSEIESDLQKLEGGINMYFSVQNQKMNQIMKTLTIIASIFIPLTFLAGVYGMNFENMPELKWDFGYYFVLIVMAVIMIGMFFFFSLKKWFK